MEERHWDLPTPKIQRVLCGETGPQVDSVRFMKKIVCRYENHDSADALQRFWPVGSSRLVTTSLVENRI